MEKENRRMKTQIGALNELINSKSEIVFTYELKNIKKFFGFSKIRSSNVFFCNPIDCLSDTSAIKSIGWRLKFTPKREDRKDVLRVTVFL